MDALEQINNCKYLYLESFRPGEDLMTLVVDVVEARAEDTAAPIVTGSSELNAVLGVGRPIAVKAGYRRFRVKFANYLSFAVTDETYAQPEDSDDYSKKIRTYASSTFLEYISKSTWATSEHPGPFAHYALVCSDHVINVVCPEPPEIDVSSVGVA
jgi:hypothetical protein